MTSNPMLRRAAMVMGIGIALFILLIVGGWAFVGGIGALFAFGYFRSGNRGLLIAAATFIGLAIGLSIELMLSRTGGVAMMSGIAFGLFGMALIIWREAQVIQWWSLILSVVLLVLTALIWSFSLEQLQLYLTVFPFGILALLIYAGYEFWRNRRSQLAALV
jgi:hypothetical protein